jgi:hypothetical protein
MWPTIIFLVEVLLRQIPTLRENSLVAILLDILDRFVPSKAKGGRKFVRNTETKTKDNV